MAKGAVQDHTPRRKPAAVIKNKKGNGPARKRISDGQDEPAASAAAHGFPLNVFFEGLCVFVRSPSGHAMRVLLVNACGSGAGSGHAHCDCPQHLPFIQLDLADIVPGADGLPSWVDLVLPRGYPADNGPSVVHFLRWEDVVLPQPAHHDLEIRDTRTPGSQEPDGDTTGHDDFSWVAELEKAAPGSGDVDPRCFDPDPPRELVIARTRLLTGFIAANKLISPDGTANSIWAFKASASGTASKYSQALASQVVHQRRITGDTVQLILQSFQAKGNTTKITLKPANGKYIQVLIGNLPLSDVIEVPLDDFPTLSTEAHFPALYQLSLHPPADPPVPSAISHPTKHALVSGVRAGTTICPGGSANPCNLA